MSKNKMSKNKKKSILKNIKVNSKIDKKLIKILKFSVVFNLFLATLYIMTRNNIYFLQQLTAELVTTLLNRTGVAASLKELMITVPVKTGLFGGTVDWDCTGWKSILVFIALVVATPTDWRKKLKAWFFIPLIYLANILRVWFVFFFVSRFGIEHFETIHKTLWSWGLIAVLLVCWVCWYKDWCKGLYRQHSRQSHKSHVIKSKIAKRKLIYSKRTKK